MEGCQKIRKKEEIMNVSAKINSQRALHQVTLTTNGTDRDLTIAPKSSGFGSSASGAELLCLALATCYCNDIFREARQRGIQVEGVEVSVDSEFGAAGEPASSLTYHAMVRAKAAEKEILDLMADTDRMAEIENTVRIGFNIPLEHMQAISIT
jgi:uncharacterized OsmC-like protein